MELEIFRGDDVVAVIETGGKNTRFTHGLMNAHKIVVTDIKQYDALQVQIEDYILRKGIKYKINTVPDLNADDQLSYNITFEGPKYTWHDKLFMDEGEADIPDYYGNALLLMQLFISNINEVDPIWSLGEIADTTEKHLVFSNVTCHEAIIIIAEAFGLEFQEQDKAITMIPKIGRDTGLNFEYGMGKGLYSLTRTYVSDKNVVTKVYGFGGNRNIPVGYRGAKKRLTFDPGFHVNNVELYGIKEGQYTNEDIIPEREASVTGTTHGNPLSTITDTTLDFNVLDAVIEGLEPKIGFTTGVLAGEEFVITDYSSTTKTITFKGFINDNNVVLPNDTFRAEVGDKYVFFDIDLPSTYVTNAEAKVDAGTLQYVLENSVPKVEYGGTIDPIHMRDNAIELIPGDRVSFKDARIGLDATIRITEISMPLDYPEVIENDTTIDITIANFVTYSAQQRLRDEKLIVRHEVKTIDLRSAEQARRNTANMLNLRDSVIDPNGNYYTELIVPGSVETLFLSVGAKATNFNLNNVSFEANVGGNPNSFIATVGQLIHYDLQLPDNGFVWEMQPYSITGLVPASKYYLYAKISKSTNVGSWELSTDVKLAESLAGFYILQAGVLFPVKDGRRDNAITKGMVFIVGDQITAGRIKSLDENMFIDLTTGQMKLGNDQYGMDWNVTTPNRLTIRGGITQNSGGISAPITLFRGVYVSGSTYYKGDTVTYNGSTWLYKNDTPSAAASPAENTFWTVVAAKGIDGGAGSTVDIEYSINGSTLWHPTFTTGDIFMRQRVGTGAWSTAIRIVGEEGEPGEDGKYTSYQFAKNTSLTVAPTTGFTDAPPSVGVGDYLWLRIGTFNTAGQIGAWSTAVRISGPQGDPGVVGPPGTNGQTLYTWVKYADTAAGAGLSDNPAGKEYIGFAYNKPTASESTNPADYSFSLIQGEGIQGPPGDDGTTFYTWLKYADTPSTGMSDSPTGKKYLGLAYNKVSPTESTTYADYMWSLIQGADGANGAPGAPGTAGNYTEFRFAKNGSTTAAPALIVTDWNPTGWTIAQPTVGAAEYAWMTSSVKTAAGVPVTNWATPIRFNGAKGDTGAPGTNGATGSSGPFMSFRGDYDPAKTYVGTTTRIEAVKYLGNYYITRTDAGTIAAGTLPTDASKFNIFTGQFESLATGLLLAELAYIENLGVRNLKTADAGRRLEIISSLNRLTFYGINSIDSSIYEALRIGDDVDSGQTTGQSLGGIRMTRPDGKVTYASGNGLFSNGSGLQFLSATLGIQTNAAVVASLQERNTDVDGISAAIVGIDATSSGNSKSYAGFFGGNVLISGKIKTNKGSNTVEGLTKNLRMYSGTTGLFWNMDVVNGIIVSWDGPST